ncbi:MAG: hypothetical protein ACREIF_03520 [Chthoniobacterales bacterium]
MDLRSANAFVLLVSENYSQYSVAMQRSLLEGIFQLADECKETLSEDPNSPGYDHFQTSLILAKLFASDALKRGNLVEGFRLAADCFWPLVAVPEDVP